MRPIFLILAGLFGFLAVAGGAYAEHGLRDQLTPHDFDAIMTALRYQLLHAVVLAALGLMPPRTARGARVLDWSGICWSLGILFFSGGIWAAKAIPMPVALHMVPMGGGLLMLGWLGLMVNGCLQLRKNN